MAATNNEIKLKRKRIWRSIVTTLAAIVVFVTTYALIIPAITWEKTLICPLEEHVHSDGCYNSAGDLTCGKEEHKHTAECFDAPKANETTYICGKAEHTHTEDCYFPDGALRCTIPEHKHTDSCKSPALLKRLAKLLGANESNPPINVEDYIPTRDPDKKQAVVLEYQKKGASSDAPWIDVTTLYTDDPENPELIPGDAKLRLNIEFENVPILDLRAADYKMQFTVPEIMRNPVVSEQITSGTTVAGRLKAEDGVVTITFDATWVEDQYKSDDSVIKGDFWVGAEIELTKAEEMTPGTVQVGDVTIIVNFDPEVVGKYGEVDINKSDAALSKDETTGAWYLTYTLTVVAGEDGCPNVSVKDIFNANAYTGAYELLGATKKTADDAEPASVSTANISTTATVDGNTVDSVTWPIGNMEPGDVYTLTYRVPLDDGYIGGRVKQTLDNTATVYYDDDVEKNHATKSFTPKADVSIQKSKTADFSVINTEEGGYYIYRVTVTAPLDNTYPLENLVIRDALDGTIAGKPATDPDIRKYLSYDTSDDPSRWQDDFAWWTTSASNPTQTSKKLDDYENALVFTEDSNGDGKHNEGFSVNIGTLVPGMTVYFRYKVKIEPGVFTEIGNADGTINNTAAIVLDGEDSPYKNANHSETITHKQWTRKLGGEKNDADLPITIGTGDGVFVITDGGVTPADHPADNTFTVPAGSYLYRIVANEAGGWDISSASLTDEMNMSWMEYQGYVRVDAYSITDPVTGENDAEVIANMAGLTPTMTSWVNVDNLTNFAFKPEDVFKDGNDQPIRGDYAYLLTYYAKAETSEVLTNVVVGNTVGLKGDVINETTPYELLGVEASADVVVQANTTFTTEKMPWYYAKASDETLTNFENGALYWIIKVDGPIAVGTQFDDFTESTVSYYHTNSLEGIYVGKLGDTTITSYKNLASLKAAVAADENLTLIPLDDGSYGIRYYKSGSNATSISNPDTANSQRALITMNQGVSLNPGESLYIIYRTEPSSLPTGNTGSKNYKNNLMTKLPAQSTFTDPQTVTQTIHTQEYIYKEGGYFIECYDDGTGFKATWNKYLTDNSGRPDITKARTDGQQIEPGYYIGWYIRLDQWDNMNGRYRVIDKIPDGLTPELVAMIAWDNSFTSGYGNHSVQIPESELPEGNWTEHVSVMNGARIWYSGSSYNGGPSYTFYWYTDDENNVLFDLDNFNPNMTSGHDVQLMIFTRVADPDVLMHGKQGVYNNTAKLYDSDGEQIDQSNASVSVTRTTLEKKMNGEGVNPLPFAITANKYGEDLIPGVSTVSVVDTLSDNLKLDLTSIEIKNLLTGQKLSQADWSVAVDGQTFTLTIPDGQPLLINYSAYLNALPGQETTIWNDAYWQGSTPPPTTHTVIVERYKYVTGGSAGADTPPGLQITKNDAHHAERTLSGASFKVERMTVNVTTGELTKDADFTALTGSTSTDGKLSFGSNALDANTVYCITETAAPYGYLLDETPHYFIVAKKIEQPKKDENGQLVTDDQGNPVTEEVYPAFLDKLNTTNPSGNAYVGLQYYEFDTKYSINVFDIPMGYELPATGGIGPAVLNVIGALIMLGAMTIGHILWRRREGRGDE